MSSSISSIPGLNKNHIAISDPSENEPDKLIARSSAFTGFPTPFNSLKEDNKIYVKFSDTAPRWRVVSKGLNLEAKCKTDSCPAYNKMVWVQQGMGSFDIIDMIFERSAKCPVCENATDNPENAGFFSCGYEIQGKIMEPERIRVNEMNIADSEEGLTTFLPSEANWVKLVINTSRI